ncbi:MAG: MlaE family ABC transporter permease [Victivallaceae bacterium]
MHEKQLSQLFLQVGNGICIVCREAKVMLAFTGELLQALTDAVRNPRKIKWQTTFYYMDKSGSDAVPIISLLGFLVGVILAFQAIVQLSRYGVESYVVNLVGTVIVTELSPLITAIVLAGRSGSAFAAEIGTMKATEEIDAMVTMGFDPPRYLVIPKVLAMLVIMPCLTIFSDICGILGGMVITCSKLDLSATEYYFKTLEVIQPVDLVQGLFKSLFFAIIIAAVGCMKGLDAGKDAQGVGKASTSAVISAIFMIIVADAIITAAFSI